MKGLIIKDLINLKKQGKMLLAVFVFYIVFSVATNSSSMLGAMVVLICTMLPITSMSFDEHVNWNRYALSMPIMRKDIVIGKYLLGILLNVSGVILTFVTLTIISIFSETINIDDIFIICCVLFSAGILFLSLILPILFKFGVEKGRLLMFIVIAAPSLLVMFASRLGIKLPDEKTLNVWAYASPVIVIIIMLISIVISIEIYNKKEF